MPNQNLKSGLKKKLSGVTRLAVLGIGSRLRQDDIAGILAAQYLEEAFQHRKSGIPLKIFFGESAPENITGKIRDFNPSHIIIVDSADIQDTAGKIAFIPADDIGCSSFSTHRMPLKMLVDYLSQMLKCNIIIIGIQPKSLSLKGKPSLEVRKSARLLADVIKEVLSDI